MRMTEEKLSSGSIVAEIVLHIPNGLSIKDTTRHLVKRFGTTLYPLDVKQSEEHRRCDEHGGIREQDSGTNPARCIRV